MKGDLGDAIRAVTTMEIVEAFDVPYRIKNGKTYLICPGHDDRNFGSCYIDQKDNGYYCYACREHVNKWDMVLKLNGNNGSEAAKWFFKTAGITQIEEHSVDPYKKIKEVLKELNEYCKNTNIYSDLKVCEKIDSPFFRYKCGEYLYSEEVMKNPLLEIYKKDKDAFKTIASSIVKSKITKLENQEKIFKSKESDGFFIDGLGLLSYGELIPSCQEKKLQLELLLVKIQEL